MSILLAFLVPPLAVYKRTGATGPFYLNLLLTLLFYLPGVFHALRLGKHR